MALSTRFGVNVYSYESDLSVGGDWFIGRRRSTRDSDIVTHADGERPSQEAALNEASLRTDGVQDSVAGRQLDAPIALSRNIASHPKIVGQVVDEERDSVIKARLSGNWVSRSESSRSRIELVKSLL